MGDFTTAAKDWAVGSVVAETDLDGQIKDFINGFGAWTSYTPTWTASTTNPTNYTATGGYTRVGKMVWFRATFDFTASTTFGTGTYSITLPVTPVSGPRWSFTGHIRNSTWHSIVGIAASSTTCALYYVSSGTTGQLTACSPTAPLTLTASTSNNLQVHGTYEAA